MSTITTGNPAPASEPQGHSPQQGQPTTPATAPVANPPNEPANPQATAPASAQPNTAAEIEALRRENEQLRGTARHFQSNYDRVSAQFRAVAGVTPPADPLAEHVAFLKGKGYDEAQARDMAEFTNRMIQPLQQQNQQLNQRLHGGSLAQQAMQAAVQANPELFADQDIATATWNAMQEEAQRGSTQLMTPEYAKFLGAQEWALKHEPWKPRANPPAAPTQPQRPQFGQPISFGGPPAGYTPAAPAQRMPDPEVARYNEEIRSHFGLKPSA